MSLLKENCRLKAWFLLFGFFIGMVLYFVAYVGNDWYVVPNDPYNYPPDSINVPVKMGLFWMCVEYECHFDLRIDYLIVKYLPYKDIQYAYQRFRVPCMALITIGMLFMILAMGSFFWYLSNFKTSKVFGLLSGIFQIITSIICLIGIIIYGVNFRGSTVYLPFGWSFWLMVVAIIILLINGISTIIFSLIAWNNMEVIKKINQSQALSTSFLSK